MKYFCILVLIIFVTPMSAFSCRCNEQSIQANYENSDMVVYVTVQDFVPAPSGEGGSAVLAISQWWKSSSPERIVVNSLTSCSQEFEVNNSYLLFLNRETSGLYYTDRCLGNELLDDKDAYSEELRKLKKSSSK